MRFGLLGEKLGHSYSPELHAFFGDYEYELFEVAPDQLGDFIRHGDFQGLNVTIPYKTTMLALCDDLTEAAAAIGSVNTVVRHPDGSLFGDNTDAAGFEGLVWKSRISIRGRKCLVLGSGGASLSVQYVNGGAAEIGSRGRPLWDKLSRSAGIQKRPHSMTLYGRAKHGCSWCTGRFHIRSQTYPEGKLRFF